MSTLVTDPALSARLIADRRACGADHHDEIWAGVYVMSLLPNNEHQQLVAQLTAILVEVVDKVRLGTTYPGVNVTDRANNWEENYRCPDVVVFLRRNPAQDYGTHWIGGPDLVIEIVSPYDRTREKIDFYEALGAHELLIIDRDPWQLELLRLADGRLASVGVSSLANGLALTSETTHLSFHLAPGADRPQVAVTHTVDGRQWSV